MQVDKNNSQYQVHEGKHKETLLEKYLNHWKIDERGSDEIFLEEPEKNEYKPEVIAEYNKIINKLDKGISRLKPEDENNFLTDLSDLIKKKANKNLYIERSQRPLNQKSISQIIKNSQ